MRAPDLCDVCGAEVPADQGHRTDMVSMGAAMCPTPMVFHDECWEQASQVWHADPDSLCAVDPLFPETGQWTLPEQTKT